MNKDNYENVAVKPIDLNSSGFSRWNIFIEFKQPKNIHKKIIEVYFFAMNFKTIIYIFFCLFSSVGGHTDIQTHTLFIKIYTKKEYFLIEKI